MGLLFSCRADYDLVCDTIFDKLKISQDDIVGIQLLRNNKVVVKFSDSSVFYAFCEVYDGTVTQLKDGEQVKIVNFSSEFNYVSIRYAPFEMSDDTIIGVLSQYGKVLSIRRNTHSIGKAQGLISGTRTAKMEIKRNIPSSVNIQGYVISCLYSGQKRTCFRCGSEIHLAANCNMGESESSNIFKETDFPAMGKKNKTTNEESSKNKARDVPNEDDVAAEYENDTVKANLSEEANEKDRKKNKTESEREEINSDGKNEAEEGDKVNNRRDQILSAMDEIVPATQSDDGDIVGPPINLIGNGDIETASGCGSFTPTKIIAVSPNSLIPGTENVEVHTHINDDEEEIDMTELSHTTKVVEAEPEESDISTESNEGSVCPIDDDGDDSNPKERWDVQVKESGVLKLKKNISDNVNRKNESKSPKTKRIKRN